MARVELLVTVDKLLADADLLSPYLSPVVGASVLVNVRGTGSPTTIYAGETGGTTVSNPLVTDANGRVNGWVVEDSYVLNISGAGITSYNQPYEAIRGDGIEKIANGIVTVAKLASAVIERIFDVGDLKLTARSTAPTGWLICDGAAVNRTTYSDLFAAIGTTYGVGDGSTTFNLPDFRGRAPVGPDPTGVRLTGPRNLGASSGAEKHTLASTESGVNSNGTMNSTGSHAHGPGMGAFFIGTSGGGGPDALNQSGSAFSQTTAAGAHSHALNARTADAAHNNMQPYQTANVLIKT